MKRLVVLCAPCGVGKTTIKDFLGNNHLLENYACIDTDEVGINWWDYAGTEREHKFSEDCLVEAVRISGDKDLLFASCMNPNDFYSSVDIPNGISSTFFIAMVCSDAEITKRLKARPTERMCGSNEFIAGQIQYSNWFKANAGKFQLFVDNTDKTVSQTAAEIAEFIKSIK